MNLDYRPQLLSRAHQFEIDEALADRTSPADFLADFTSPLAPAFDQDHDYEYLWGESPREIEARLRAEWDEEMAQEEEQFRRELYEETYFARWYRDIMEEMLLPDSFVA